MLFYTSNDEDLCHLILPLIHKSGMHGHLLAANTCPEKKNIFLVTTSSGKKNEDQVNHEPPSYTLIISCWFEDILSHFFGTLES